MPPVHPSITRRPLHRRALDVQVFARDDDLFDVEASLPDTKSHDVPLAGAPRKAGDPIHEMQLHLPIDATLTVTADTRWMPYPDACVDHGDAYAKLVGPNLLKGFRQAAAERLGDTQGCTHLTELCQILPTAAIRTIADSFIDTRERPNAPSALPPEGAETPRGGPSASREGDAAGNPPFQLDRSHALKRDGTTVAKFYPRWHLATPASTLTVS